MSKNNLYLNSDNLNKIAIDDFERACKTLELDKVLNILCGFCAIEGAKKKVFEMRPSVSAEKIKQDLRLVSEAKVYLETKGGPSFGGAKDISGHIAMARKSAMLSMQALLDIAGVLTAVMSRKLSYPF